MDKPKTSRGGRTRGKPFIDPNDKLAFFKDNIIDPDDEDQFDPNAYYYNRQEKEHNFTGSGQPGFEPTGGPSAYAYPGSLHQAGYGRPPPNAYTNAQQPGLRPHPARGLSMSGAFGQVEQQADLKWRSASSPAQIGQAFHPSDLSVSLGDSGANFREAEHELQKQQQDKQRHAQEQRQASDQQQKQQQATGQLQQSQIQQQASQGQQYIRQSDEIPSQPNAYSYGFPHDDGQSLGDAQNTNPNYDTDNAHFQGSEEPLRREGIDSSEFMGSEGMILDHVDPYGLLGLLKILNMTNRDLNTLASGIDLTTLGLNLSSSDSLYSTFASPFSDTPLKRDNQYQIPPCYFIQPPLPPPVDKMSLFSDETLFYIFYTMPQDALQAAAANELLARDWSYHTELKLWFQRAPGTVPMVKTMSYETGSYVYFDVRHWREMQRINFNMEYDKLYNPPH